MKTLLCVAVLAAWSSLADAATNEGRVFPDWRAAYGFIAEACDDLRGSVDDDTVLFKLAAESSIKVFWLDVKSTNIVIVVEVDMFRGPYSLLRGAQGNGLYFLFCPCRGGLRYVGTMEGCRYQWGTVNNQPQFTTSWHMGGRQAYESVYQWDGDVFRRTSHKLWQYDDAGGRREVDASNGVSRAADVVP